MAGACALVGVLTTLGVFNSISGFPLVFAAICLGIGLLEIWRTRDRKAVAVRLLILLAGVSVPVGGRVIESREIASSMDAHRLVALEEIESQLVTVSLQGLDPLNTDQAAWDEAASLRAPATILTFWAVWCSPCWKEMEELEELYREYGERGLQVVAVTRYDDPDDEDERLDDSARSQRFLERREITYPTAITDRDDVYRQFLVPTPPAAVLIDAEGRVVDFAISLDSARALMAAAVRLL